MSLKSQLQYLNLNKSVQEQSVGKRSIHLKLSSFRGFYCDFPKAMQSMADPGINCRNQVLAVSMDKWRALNAGMWWTSQWSLSRQEVSHLGNSFFKQQNWIHASGSLRQPKRNKLQVKTLCSLSFPSPSFFPCSDNVSVENNGRGEQCHMW